MGNQTSGLWETSWFDFGQDKILIAQANIDSALLGFGYYVFI